MTTSNIEGKVFYIKNKLFFSDNKEEIEIYPEIDNINILGDHSNFLNKNKEIIQILEDYIKKQPKRISVFGVYKNHKKVSEELEKKFKQNKSKFKKPSLDDYNFMEKTSQIEILNQLINQSNYKDKLEDMKNKIQTYSNAIKSEEAEKTKQLNEQIEMEEEKLEQKKRDKKIYEEEKIVWLEEKILETEKQIERNLEKKEKLEKVYHESDAEKKSKKELISAEQKIEKTKFQIEDNKIAIEIIKAKVSQINDRIKMGKKKCIKPIPFILTLGLVYWTEYSDCKHIKFTLEEKANKIKEKNLVLEKKIHRLEHELDTKRKASNQLLQEFNKLQEDTNKKIEELEKENRNNEKEIEKLKRKLDENGKELEKKRKEIEDAQKDLTKILSVKLEFDENSTEKMVKQTKEIEKKIVISIEKMKEIKQLLENQKINLEGEWIVKVDKQ